MGISEKWESSYKIHIARSEKFRYNGEKGGRPVKYAVKQGCTLCGMCLYECPVGAIRMEKTGAHIAQDKCIGCGSCAENCASEAIVAVEEKE